MASQSALVAAAGKTVNDSDHIASFYCLLENSESCARGDGVIIDFDRLCELISLLPGLHWKERGRVGELQTNYALVTCHNTFPGLSPDPPHLPPDSDISSLKGWTISCPAIKNGDKHKLRDLVCGVISCCGPESLFSRVVGGETVGKVVGLQEARALIPHPNDAHICEIGLNVTILFHNNNFEKLLRATHTTLSPPVVSVQKYLDHNACMKELEQIISEANCRKEQQSECSSTPLHVYYRNNAGGCPQTMAVSTTECEHIPLLSMKHALNHEISMYEKFQKLTYHSGNSAMGTLEKCFGSPLVYYNHSTKEFTVIGVHVGYIQGRNVALTFYGILRLLQGGPAPVLSVLRLFKSPRLWPSRWVYLLIPHLEDPGKKMEFSYLFEILHFLLEERCGTRWAKLLLDLQDVENEAAVDLLSPLFKRFESVDRADLNTALTEIHVGEIPKEGIDGAILQLCKGVVNILEGAIRERVPERRVNLVEKCCKFYCRLLNFKYSDSENLLRKPENLRTLESVHHTYNSSAVVQGSIAGIYMKCYHTLEDDYRRLEEIANTLQMNSAEELKEEKAEFERQRYLLQRENEQLRAQNLRLQTQVATLQLTD